MRLVVDALGVRPGSAAIVIGNLLSGWVSVAPDDQIVVLTDGPAQFAVPEGVVQRALVGGDVGMAGRLWAQSVGVRRECRGLAGDALLSAVTAGSLLGGGGCPTGAIVYDLRHELRPDQFGRGRRWARRVLYGWTFSRADRLFCISDRTRQDLLRTRPRRAAKAVTAHLGADHAAGWRAAAPGTERYALAFGHFANKNVDVVLRAWASAGLGSRLKLRICGLPSRARPEVQTLVDELGLTDSVELLGWLSDEEFETVFAGAAVTVFPSDFEGFGLPAVEAMLLGIPVVVSADPALLEVTAGHAVVVDDDSPEALGRAVVTALDRTADQREAAVRHARGFTWAEMARTVRAQLQTGR